MYCYHTLECFNSLHTCITVHGGAQLAPVLKTLQSLRKLTVDIEAFTERNWETRVLDNKFSDNDSD